MSLRKRSIALRTFRSRRTAEPEISSSGSRSTRPHCLSLALSSAFPPAAGSCSASRQSAAVPLHEFPAFTLSSAPMQPPRARRSALSPRHTPSPWRSTSGRPPHLGGIRRVRQPVALLAGEKGEAFTRRNLPACPERGPGGASHDHPGPRPHRPHARSACHRSRGRRRRPDGSRTTVTDPVNLGTRDKTSPDPIRRPPESRES